jgi:molecular chaperone HtpG
MVRQGDLCLNWQIHLLINMNHKFQINLSGIIDLLSNHLYSSPQVFLRELLQNGVDAIRARENVEPSHDGNLSIEIVNSTKKDEATLIFVDNGIGLTEDEIHRFLSTIGESSKREESIHSSNDFLGKFGIGLLSCFVVSDEIVLLTRSIKSEAKTIEWRGHSDGTYSIRYLEQELTPGTRIYLRGKKGFERYFQRETIFKLAAHFGSILPYPITITNDNKTEIVNKEAPPWQQEFSSLDEKRQVTLDFGLKNLEVSAFDYIDLKSFLGGVEGIAFILPYAPSPAAKPTHQVYLKNMLLSEKVTDLLPDWAFFVKCIINVRDLRPTASRESFYEDANLAAVRGILGECIKSYLLELSQNQPDRFQQLISLHCLAIKALAIHDDEFYRLLINLLPFETSMGTMTIADYRQHSSVIRYVATVDRFRQISGIADSQSICIINGGYVYDLDLLEKLPHVFPDISIERVDSSALIQEFTELTFPERERAFNFIKVADLVLQQFKCSAEIRKFLPQELPAIYSLGTEGNFQRSLIQSKEIANPLWSSVLSGFETQSSQSQYAQICFNWNNSLIQKLIKVDNLDSLKLSIQILYIQTLLLGHYPLNFQEMTLLNQGLLQLIELGIDKEVK